MPIKKELKDRGVVHTLQQKRTFALSLKPWNSRSLGGSRHGTRNHLWLAGNVLNRRSNSECHTTSMLKHTLGIYIVFKCSVLNTVFLIVFEISVVFYIVFVISVRTRTNMSEIALTAILNFEVGSNLLTNLIA